MFLFTTNGFNPGGAARFCLVVVIIGKTYLLVLYAYICICVYIYIYMYLSLYTYKPICVYIYIYIHTQTYVYIRAVFPEARPGATSAAERRDLLEAALLPLLMTIIHYLFNTSYLLVGS